MAVSVYGGAIFATLFAVGGVVEAANAPVATSPSEVVLERDQEMQLQDVKALCAREEVALVLASAEPDTGYSLHLALVDGQGNFLPGGIISVDDALQRTHLRMRCRGDWLMLDMEPGIYAITAQTGGKTRTHMIEVPKFGRARLALSFGDIQVAGTVPAAG